MSFNWKHYPQDDMDPDDAPRYRHRCTGAAADHCRICSYLPEPGEDDEAEDQCAHEWVTSDPEEGGDGRCYCLNCDADGDG